MIERGKGINFHAKILALEDLAFMLQSLNNLSERNFIVKVNAAV